MANLRDFVTKIDEESDLLHIEESLSPRLEIPALLMKLDGKAVLFEKVKGYSTRVIGGVCGSRKRILKALGIKSQAFHKHLLRALRNPTPCEVRNGPVKEVVEQLGLRKIPVLTHFKGEPGPTITSGIIYAKSPNGAIENVSVHRMRVLDESRMVVRIESPHLLKITQMARDSGISSINVSISIGLHPALMIAAASPAPFGTCEFEVANTLLNGDLTLTKCEHIDALAPSDAELVLEGRLHLDEEDIEGPFINISGTWKPEKLQPVIEVLGVMHRENYIYQALLPSSMEHKLLEGMPSEVVEQSKPYP